MNTVFSKQTRDNKGRWVKSPKYVKKIKATTQELTDAFIAGYQAQSGFLPLGKKIEMYLNSLGVTENE